MNEYDSALTNATQKPVLHESGCGRTHASCDYNPKGSCEHEDGHSGNHKCGSCGSSF